MKKIVLIILVLTGFYGHVRAQDAIIIPKNAKKLLFLGNSITYAGHYVSYIETVLRLQYPNRTFEVINVGLPSETVSGLSEPGHAGGKFPRPDLHERLDRILQQLKPDLVFANYGMNDGIYLPLDDFRFQQFKDGMRWMHDRVVTSGATIIHLTPPVFDGADAAVYDHVLETYSNWLIDQKTKAEWLVIDIHGPMKKELQAKRLVAPSFAFAQDGVHPGEIGHWVMARQTLLALGVKKMAQLTSPQQMTASFVHGETILALIEKRQAITKDAWLTSIGHKRPGMNVGYSLEEAQQKADVLEKRIRKLLAN